jgi:hypothetical protein
MDSTETLPARINSPAFRYGIVTGVDSKYNANGSVQTLNDINTIHFDSDQLKKISPDIQTLVLILNQNSGNRHLGDQLDLGTLRVETEPDVRYLVPIYARGLTDNFTLAVAMPVVFYKNRLDIVQSNSNAAGICDQIGSTPSADLKEACDKLRNTRMTDEVRGQLAAKGYKPVQDRDETLLGDMQVVGLYRFYAKGPHSALVRTTLNLPTGKADDPDDLADLGTFGETAVENELLYNYVATPTLRLSAKAAYRLTLPDHVDARVPRSDDDLIPDQDTKERLGRNLGDTITLGAAATWNVFGDFSVAGGYELASKAADHYAGEKGSRYDLLGKDTASVAHRLRGGLGYDTIGLYKRKKNFPPMKFDFEVSNTIAGKNVDRELVNELSVTLFF